jgi:hypothetical protein
MESGRPREEGVAVAVDDAWWLPGFESLDGRLLWWGCGLGGSPEEKKKCENCYGNPEVEKYLN